MQFRIAYEGELVSTQDQHAGNAWKDDARRFQKHALRRAFHPQLKHLWATHPSLIARNKNAVRDGKSLIDQAAEDFPGYGYNYVPLLRKGAQVLCKVDILFLRRQMPGGLIRGGDLDNRLKTLYDGLRMPCNGAEMKDIPGPELEEVPFFVLLEDDNLITHSAVETDILMDAPKGNSDADMNRVRLVLTVTITPYAPTLDAIGWL